MLHFLEFLMHHPHQALHKEPEQPWAEKVMKDNFIYLRQSRVGSSIDFINRNASSGTARNIFIL